MKLFRKLAAAALAAALTLSCLTACAPGGGEDETTDDIIRQTAGIPADTVLFTLDGQEITAEEYLYWAAYSADYLVSYFFGSADALDWSDGTVDEFVRANALDAVSLYRQAQAYAGELGIALTDEERAAMDADIQETVDTLGSEEQYARRLQQSAISPEGFRAMLERFYLYSALLDRVYGPEGSQPVTEADLEDYIDENGIYRAKHILLLTVDQVTREPLDDETVAEKKALIDDLLTQLRASGEPLTLFDQLMNEYSEDTGLATNPDGYTTHRGEMVSAFEDTALALEPGEISGIVESPYGYHIILRLPLEADSYREDYISYLMGQQQQAWLDENPIQTNENFDKIDPSAYYTQLLSLRAAVEEEAAALQEDASTGDSSTGDASTGDASTADTSGAASSSQG